MAAKSCRYVHRYDILQAQMRVSESIRTFSAGISHKYTGFPSAQRTDHVLDNAQKFAKRHLRDNFNLAIRYLTLKLTEFRKFINLLIYNY